MTDVIKKGMLEVKKRNRFGGYKLKYVLLSNSLTLKCKTVEILDNDGSKSNVEVIRLNDIWSVQDKPSRTKYAFELVLGDDPILTFSCNTVLEREEWTEAFRVLNQLALPTMSNSSSPMTDRYYPVTLMKNHSALEIGHSGQYLLSITGSAVVLHWRTGAIAHHWPIKNITKLYHPGREGHLKLNVRRVSGSGAPQDFEFISDKDNAVDVLKLWNIRLLESIPGDPQQLNEISSTLTSTVQTSGKMNRKSKSFKVKSHDKERPFVRTGSLTFKKNYETSSSTLGGISLSQVQPSSRSMYGDSRSRFDYTADSQESGIFGPGCSSPPPLPPRPAESSSDEDDPDYAYIDENEVKGPGGGGSQVKRTPSSELDDQLAELKKSIARENKFKRREAERKKEQTIHRLRTNLQFIPADPQDYLIPVPSKRSQTYSVSSETRELSDPHAQDLSPSSNEGNSPVFVPNPPSVPPRGRSYGVNENNIDRTSKHEYYNERAEPAPPIPPRSPTKTRQSSSSSSMSSLSSASRCPKCHSIRKTKSTVGKTVSLDPRFAHPRVSKEDARKSLPNLDSHQQHHCCSQDDSDHTPIPPPTHTPSTNDYLPLLDEKAPVDVGRRKSELGPELDLLTSCLQTLESRKISIEEPLFTEDPKPTTTTTTTTTTHRKKRSPYDQLKLKSEGTKSQEISPAPYPPTRSTTGSHRPLSSSTSQSSHRPLSTSTSQSSWMQASVFNTQTQPRSHTPRSRSSLDHSPPVPPRSSVSLTHVPHVPNGNSTRSAGQQSLGRRATVVPPRSKSVLDHTPNHNRTLYASQGDNDKSKTVFIHHIKDRRLLPSHDTGLAHMV